MISEFFWRNIMRDRAKLAGNTYLAKQTKPESELVLALQFTKSPPELSTSPNEFEQILTGYSTFCATTEDADDIPGRRYRSSWTFVSSFDLVKLNNSQSIDHDVSHISFSVSRISVFSERRTYHLKILFKNMDIYFINIMVIIYNFLINDKNNFLKYEF